MSDMGTYRLSIVTDELDINTDQPKRLVVRSGRFDSDAQAELHARRISEADGVWVEIQRPGATWSVLAPKWVG